MKRCYINTVRAALDINLEINTIAAAINMQGLPVKIRNNLVVIDQVNIGVLWMLSELYYQMKSFICLIKHSVTRWQQLARLDQKDPYWNTLCPHNYAGILL